MNTSRLQRSSQTRRVEFYRKYPGPPAELLCGRVSIRPGPLQLNGQSSQSVRVCDVFVHPSLGLKNERWSLQLPLGSTGASVCQRWR